MTTINPYKGYTSSREINGQIIPQRVQNAIIRNYVKMRELDLFLSATEYYMEGCYMILHARLEELNDLSGLIFYSTDLLPKDKMQRQKIYEIIVNHGCSLHFALEELEINTFDDIHIIEDIMLCRELRQHKHFNLLNEYI